MSKSTISKSHLVVQVYQNVSNFASRDIKMYSPKRYKVKVFMS